MKNEQTIAIIKDIANKNITPTEQRAIEKAIAALQYCGNLTYYTETKRFGDKPDMREKIKEKIKKYTRKIGKAGLVITSLLCCTSTCFAGVQDSKIATGTQNLITDLTNWLLILAPTLTILLVGYYLLRKSSSDDMDGKRWDNRIKIAIICCVGVVVASGLINLIIGYYR